MPQSPLISLSCVPTNPVVGDELEVEVAIESLVDAELKGASLYFTGVESTLEPLNEVRSQQGRVLIELSSALGAHTVKVTAEAIERVPAPKALESHLWAWREAATRVNGRLEVGSRSIREVTFRERAVELIHRPGPTGALEGPFAQVRFAPGASMPEAAQRIADSVTRECQAFRVMPDGVEATMPGLLAEPSRAETLWRALIRVADVIEA